MAVHTILERVMPTNEIRRSNFKSENNFLIKKQLKEFELLLKRNAEELHHNPNQHDALALRHVSAIEELHKKQAAEKEAFRRKYNHTTSSVSGVNNEEFCFQTQRILEHFICQESKKITAILLECKERKDINPNDLVAQVENEIFTELTNQYELEIKELFKFLRYKYVKSNTDFCALHHTKGEFDQFFIDLSDLPLGLYFEKLMEANEQAKEVAIETEESSSSKLKDTLSMIDEFFQRKLYNFIIDMLLMRIGDNDLLAPIEQYKNVSNNIASYKYKEGRQKLLNLVLMQMRHKAQMNQQQPDNEKWMELNKAFTKQVNDCFLEVDTNIKKFKTLSGPLFESKPLDRGEQTKQGQLLTHFIKSYQLVELKYKYILHVITQEFSNYEDSMIKRQTMEIKESPDLAEKHLIERKALNNHFIDRLAQCRKVFLDAMSKNCAGVSSERALTPKNTVSHISTEITTHKPDGTIMINKKETISDLPSSMGDGKNIIEAIAERALNDSLARVAQAMSEKSSKDVMFEDKIIIDNEELCGELQLKGNFNISIT